MNKIFNKFAVSSTIFGILGISVLTTNIFAYSKDYHATWSNTGAVDHRGVNGRSNNHFYNLQKGDAVKIHLDSVNKNYVIGYILYKSDSSYSHTDSTHGTLKLTEGQTGTINKKLGSSSSKYYLWIGGGPTNAKMEIKGSVSQ